jgi:hypothetical protein
MGVSVAETRPCLAWAWPRQVEGRVTASTSGAIRHAIAPQGLRAGRVEASRKPSAARDGPRPLGLATQPSDYRINRMKVGLTD